MNFFILIHSFSIIIAFFIGIYIFVNPKGTRSHKLAGRFFVIFMLISLISSFFIQTKGRFSFIHLLSIMGIYWLLSGLLAIYRNKKNERYAHASHMTSAFISIIIAGAGVIGRHYIFPGNVEYGFLLSAVIAIPTVFIAKKMLQKYFIKE